MAETISPVVHGGRNRSYWKAITAHLIGAALASALVGALLGSIGSIFDLSWSSAGLALVAILAAVYALGELTGLKLPLPHRRGQVPEWWRNYFEPTTTAFLYGAGLGVGFATHVRSGLLLIVAVVAFLGGSPVLGALLLTPFGIARAASVVIGFGFAERFGASSLTRFVGSGALLAVSAVAGSFAFSV
jgi:hypothetical protein